MRIDKRKGRIFHMCVKWMGVNKTHHDIKVRSHAHTCQQCCDEDFKVPSTR